MDCGKTGGVRRAGVGKYGAALKSITISIWCRAFQHIDLGLKRLITAAFFYKSLRESLSNYFGIKDIHSHLFKFKEDSNHSSVIPQHPSLINRFATPFFSKSSSSFSYSPALQYVFTRNPSDSHSQTWRTPNATRFRLATLYPSVCPAIHRHRAKTIHDLGSRWHPLPRLSRIPIRPGQQTPPQVELIIISYLHQMPTLRNLPHLPPMCKALVALTRIGPNMPAPNQSTSGSAASALIATIRNSAQKGARFARTRDASAAPNTLPAHTFNSLKARAWARRITFFTSFSIRSPHEDWSLAWQVSVEGTLRIYRSI